MTIIADSGSTKTDWVLLNRDKGMESFSTNGLNPVLLDKAAIISEIGATFSKGSLSSKVNAVHFYGAGCFDEPHCTIVESALQVIFPNASFWINNDLLAAARAICGTSEGIACILGTGANSCFFDGQKIVDNVPPLGYILGDEGSGTYLGKQLLRHYFYRELPPELERRLLADFSISKKKVIEAVYRQPNGNRYLANFAKWIIEQKKHPFVQQLLLNALDDFIKRQVLKYDRVREVPIHFIGSIAFFLQKEVKIVIEKNGLLLGKINRRPMEGLIKFHLQSSDFIEKL
ncbi:MAG: hypothetical protein AAF960_04990 [Bacteroidota bacterium]